MVRHTLKDFGFRNTGLALMGETTAGKQYQTVLEDRL